MKFDEKNVVIQEVLTKQEIEEIYWLVSQNKNKDYLMKAFTQNISNFDLPYRIAKKIITLAEDISGEAGLEIEDYQFARYKNTEDPDGGGMLFPSLTPHCDLTFPQPRFTIDYQIGANTSWPIVVEGEEFSLANNEALTFSGTHQVHWRTHKKFSDSEYVDMVFFHLRKRKSDPYSNADRDLIQEKINKFAQEYVSKENL
jgi:hypothetical protein